MRLKRIIILDLFAIKNAINDPNVPWEDAETKEPNKFDCFVKLKDGSEHRSYYIERGTFFGPFFVSSTYPNDRFDDVAFWKLAVDGDEPCE